MISIILTAWREEKTIGRTMASILGQVDGLGDEVEVILVCPDEGTEKAARRVVEKRGYTDFVYIKDPQKGKPFALNMAFEKAKGDIIVSTDGDVRIDESSLKPLLEPFADKSVGGVTGRPICINDRSNIWGYWGHMFIDAAHAKRQETLAKGEFFIMSGYLLAVRNIGWDIPDGVLDDVYFSYKVNEAGLRIAYAPDAKVYVKQPTNIEDWLKQKVRNVAGHSNLEEHVKEPPESRTFLGDLKYALWPISYARSFKELIWSLMHYPLRLYVWAKCWWELKVQRKQATQIWKRVGSTK